MHQVERAGRQPGAPGIRGHDLHPGKSSPGGEPGRHGGMGRVSIQAGHPPAGEHPLRQQVEDAARPATKIDRAVPGPQAHPVQQRGGVDSQLIRLAKQPIALPLTGAQRVDRGGIRTAAGRGLDRSGHGPTPFPRRGRRPAPLPGLEPG
jgi:hypothetical protein